MESCIFSDGPRYIQDHTEGRLDFVNKEVSAYIAGFFDGDGSVRLQLQPRKRAKFGFRLRAVVSFAQKVGHKKHLIWIKNKLGIGYIYTRNDGMDELKIEGFKPVERILTKLAPFVHFKRKQVSFVLKALGILKRDPNAFLKAAKISDSLSAVNYATTKRKYTSLSVENFIKQN